MDCRALIGPWRNRSLSLMNSSSHTSSPAFRPRRSALYLPGVNRRAHDKARSLDADVLIFDLEDSVAPDAKDEARSAILDALTAGGYGDRERVVRINAPDTPWGQADCEAFASAPVDALLVPKVTDPETLRRLGDRLGRSEGAPVLWAMMETARAILAAAEIAASHPALRLFCMGLEDLATELRADGSPPRTAMLYALEQTLMAARAHGLGILDGVYPPFRDGPGFEASCAQGRMLGFDGKQVIHPCQIAPANAAFGPVPERVEDARRIIAAFESARAEGKGVAVLDGRMVEALHVEDARRLVAMADMLAARKAENEG